MPSIYCLQETMKNDYKIKKFKSNDPDGASFWKLIHPIGKTGGIICGVWEEINCPIAASYVIKMSHTLIEVRL